MLVALDVCPRSSWYLETNNNEKQRRKLHLAIIHACYYHFIFLTQFTKCCLHGPSNGRLLVVVLLDGRRVGDAWPQLLLKSKKRKSVSRHETA